ncbi:hypothetical protein GCM10011401_18590 [Nesterenkonia cremea]|uniref:Uncharacterized protein n=1 Tax=Nesterenkonia cremea TaxID=1882340 RepID=A0A917AS73_9MICC|nr:hypothetical protein GCM10011401_18590 [Nesterenkonia cremea]
MRSDLSIPERSFYTFMPYFLPFGVLMTLLTVYDFAFPRVLKITLDGVRSRFWKLSWSEITDIRVIGQAGRSKSQGQPMVVLDVIPQAHSREKWKNMRDSLRVWALYIPIIPAPKYEIRLQTTLRVGGEDLAAYLRDCRVRATQGLPLIPPMG